MSTAIDQQIVTFQEQFNRAKTEVGKVIVGYGEIIDGVIMSMLASGHVLLEGVPGLGKTKLVSTLSDVMHLKFSRIQFTPDLMPADITGTNVVQENAMGEKFLEFQPGPIFSNIVLADEVNRATPKTQSALLEAMEERSVTVGKTTHRLDSPFFVLATQNPLEMEGTYPLPEAQLDRFFMKLRVDYPTVDNLHTILNRTTKVQEPQCRSCARPGRSSRNAENGESRPDCAAGSGLRNPHHACHASAAALRPSAYDEICALWIESAGSPGARHWRKDPRAPE